MVSRLIPPVPSCSGTRSGSSCRSELDGTGQVHILARPSYFAVGFHDAIDRLYYSDLNKLITYYAASDGTGQTIFWSGMGIATGGALAIQVDHVANKVYWLDGGDRWLRKADPDGSNLEDVFYLSGDAYDIALDLPGARVYWCGRSTGSIYRRNLDGSGVTETLYSGLNLPRGLTLDYTVGRVIWGEDDQIAHGTHRRWRRGHGRLHRSLCRDRYRVG